MTTIAQQLEQLDQVLALVDQFALTGRANWTHPKREVFANELRSRLSEIRAAVGGDAVAVVEQTAPEGLHARFIGAGSMYTVTPGAKLYASHTVTVDVGALRTLLADDALANEVAGRCRDKDHDDRWCPTCSSRSDGIEDYRDELAALIGKEA